MATMRIYAGILPNADNNTHYVFKSKASYNTVLLPFLTATLENERYSYLDGIVTIANRDGKVDIDTASYVSIEYENGKFRYYFVDEIENKSNNIYLSLTFDTWANYISDAIIENIFATRCNRNIGAGVYDPIESTSKIDFGSLTPESEISQDELTVVFVVVYATGVSTIFQNNSGTSIGMYTAPLSDFPIPEGSRYVNRLAWVMELVSSIFSVEGGAAEKEAGTIKAYILPNELLPSVGATRPDTIPRFRCKPASQDGEWFIKPAMQIAGSYARKEFDFYYDPNFKYYVGTRYDGFEITRTTETSVKITYESIMKADGVQIICRQGDKMLDITNAFSVGLTTNDGNMTGIERLSAAVSAIGSLSSGAFQIMAGGPGIVTGALQIGSTLAGSVREGNAKYSPAGDGYTTFCRGGNIYNQPYFYSRNRSIIDEVKHAGQYGANFEKNLTSLEEAKNAPKLDANGRDDVFIKCTSNVSGCCRSAANFIAGELESGIYYEVIA